MFRKSILWLLAAMSLVSCSTTVHLYTQGLEKQEVDKLYALLAQEGFSVRRNARAIPEEVTSPLLVYSPLNKRPQEISELQRLLESQGYSPDWVLNRVGNNHYSGQHIGLYLAPYAEPDAGRQSALVDREFHGLCFSSDTYLGFDVYGGYRLEIVSNQTDTENIERFGSWSETGESVTLIENGEETVLSLEHFTGEVRLPDRSIQVSAVRLINPGTFLDGCDLAWQAEITL